jgi:hypothetical protein
MRCIREEIERLDTSLASLAQEETALRLRLGQVLEVLSRGGFFDLGFSSLAAYALERCERSVRWAESARCLARRVEALPELRRAIATGRVSWSMGELLARAAQPEDEAHWVEAAESRTVRQMRGIVMRNMAARREAGGAECEQHAARSTAPAVAAVVTAPAAAAMATAPVVSTASASVAVAAAPALPTTPAVAVFTTPGVSDNGHDDGHAQGAHADDGHADDDDAHDGDAHDGDAHDDDAHDGGAHDGGAHDGYEMCTLTCTVDQEEAWLFEATQSLLGQLGVHGMDAQSEALLAEGQGTLLAALPEGAIDYEQWEECDTVQRRWVQQLGRWRAEAEALCEERIMGSRLSSRGQNRRECCSEPIPGSVTAAAALGMASLDRAACDVLDGHLRGLSQALARHELELSRLVLAFHRADGWRRLGYATETQYARERLGLSRSSLLARRALALRLEKLPLVAAALGAADIGVEAALQVVRVATTSTQAAWVDRARHRTIKHLREEVSAALTAVRVSGEVDCSPPADGELAAFHELEQAVVSGRACHGAPTNSARVACGASTLGMNTGRLAEPASDERRAWFVMLGSLARWLDSGLQLSAVETTTVGPRGRSGAGRTTLRLRLSRSTYAWWRGLEAQARRWLPRGISWLRFLCLTMWHAWRHLLGADVAYARIYVRDRYRCMSPVCGRRDVTPHHLRFRSAGGSDDDDNVGSVCTWCHLCGVHGGRIRATGTARLIHWELGAARSPCLVVHGRERVAA